MPIIMHISISSILISLLLTITKKAISDISVFLIEPHNDVVQSGESIILQCKVKKMIGQAFWLRDGTEVDLVKNRRYTYVGDPNEGEYNLKISKASSSEDAGSWQCQVKTDTYPIRSRGALLNVVDYEEPVKYFHYCMRDRFLITLDFLQPTTATLSTRNSKCSLKFSNERSISFFIPFYDCGTFYTINQARGVTNFTNMLDLPSVSGGIARLSFHCYFTDISEKRYHTITRGILDRSTLPVPFKRILPSDCPFEIPYPEIMVSVKCPKSTYSVTLMFQHPFTGVIKLSDKGECEFQLIEQRNFTKTFPFGSCGDEKVPIQTPTGIKEMNKNVIYIEQHCSLRPNLKFISCFYQ